MENDQHRALAAQFFNAVWGLLDKFDRSPEEDLQMIHLAHASRAHWQFVGGTREWAIARVYAVLGQPEAALFHARATLDLTAGDAVGTFLNGCAHEVMARACRAAGRLEAALQQMGLAAAIADGLTDAEERELLVMDLTGAR